MGRPPQKADIYVADFETTVYEGQQETAVWAAAIVPINTEDVSIFNSIEGFFRYITMIPGRKIIYFHNLKFDGSFILDYLIRQKETPQAFNKLGPLTNHDMPAPSVKYSISNKGQWYTITYKPRSRDIIEFRDSLKLLPFSVRQLGEGFKTKHRKLNMKYEGFRYPGCNITDKEKEYIANDVLVVKEALEMMFARGHNKLTIGSCCLSEFKSMYDKDMYEMLFPNQYEVKLPKDKYGFDNAGEYVRTTYKGAWCYVVPEKANRIQYLGLTFDVNSLYPSVMHSQSGNYYPVGQPRFWLGNMIPDFLLPENNVNDRGGIKYYWFIRIRTKFRLKENKLPFIQIKHDLRYRQNEMLKTSDFYYKGKYYSELLDNDGNPVEARPILSLTMTDYFLMLEHYDLYDTEILNGVYYAAEIGLFDQYIDKYAQQKINANTKAERTEAKLFLNNLYGKLAMSTDSSYKLVYVNDKNSLSFQPVMEHEKTPGYIPCGSAVTSYARYFTITAAQKNYYGPDKPGFIYADTDSLHISELKPEEIIGVPEHPTAFLHWKNETKWDYAIFVRQKTYIEHITEADGEPVEPYYNVTCAGMPERSQNLLKRSLSDQHYNPDDPDDIEEDYDETEIRFMNTHRDISQFRIHLQVPGCLKAKRIPGGIILNRGIYEMRPR